MLPAGDRRHLLQDGLRFTGTRDIPGAGGTNAVFVDQHRHVTRTITRSDVLVAAQGGSSCTLWGPCIKGWTPHRSHGCRLLVPCRSSRRCHDAGLPLAQYRRLDRWCVGAITAVQGVAESFAELWAFMGPMDIYGGLIKTTLFGLLSVISCYHGFRRWCRGRWKAVNDTVAGVVAYALLFSNLCPFWFGRPMTVVTNVLSGLGRYSYWVRDFCRSVIVHGPKAKHSMKPFESASSLPILLISRLLWAQFGPSRYNALSLWAASV